MNRSQIFELVTDLLSKRAGPYSPLTKIFAPHRDELARAVGLQDGKLDEIIYNALNNLYGRGKCKVCQNATKLYPHRGGWAEYCSKKCMNSAESPRVKNAEATKKAKGTHISNSVIRQKSAATLKTNYGVDNPSLSPTIKEKRTKTFIGKFGETTPLKNQTVKQCISRTMNAKYGGTGTASPIIREKILASRRKNSIDALLVRAERANVVAENIETYNGCFSELNWWCLSCSTKFTCAPYDGNRGAENSLLKCPKCYPSHVSNPQRKITEFLETLGVRFTVNDRSTIKPLELDIVVPEKMLAIEINGLYFHGENSGKTRLYHLTKTKRAAEKGFQLIHLTDYEVVNRQAAVETMLQSKLGLLPRIYARDTQVEEIDRAEADDFLEKYHLQGACRAGVRLGLRHRGELVAVMTFGRPRFNRRFTWELLRFCSSKTVVGGASKLIANFRKDRSGSIISYADRRWSTGEMYKKIGFSFIGETSPSYWYFNQQGELHHRSKFQRHLLNDQSNQSEKEIMQARGWDRIWDCGTLRYVLTEGE